MTPPEKSVWSLVGFGCPLLAIALAFAAGRGIADEKLAFRVVGFGGLGFLLLALVSLICAFARKEKLRWFTILPVFVLLAMFGTGISS